LGVLKWATQRRLLNSIGSTMLNMSDGRSVAPVGMLSNSCTRLAEGTVLVLSLASYSTRRESRTCICSSAACVRRGTLKPMPDRTDVGGAALCDRIKRHLDAVDRQAQRQPGALRLVDAVDRRAGSAQLAGVAPLCQRQRDRRPRSDVASHFFAELGQRLDHGQHRVVGAPAWRADGEVRVAVRLAVAALARLALEGIASGVGDIFGEIDVVERGNCLSMFRPVT
jgi:hypothetical protein